jgi:DNA-binding MarR family transcriptional regulator
MQSIEKAIHQKEFKDLGVKSDVNIMYTASWLIAEKTRLLRPMDLSLPQFNILRILRGAKGDPVSVRYLAERMIDQSSNASRLVDKLVQKGLALRRECPSDRRLVEITITPQGLTAVEQATQAIAGHQRCFSMLTDHEMQTLNTILDKIRNT